MSIHLSDSRVYGHLWATDEARDLFGEEARFEAWLEILAVLAEAQAAIDLIPEHAATDIRKLADEGSLDLEQVAAETRASGHSTLGLIRVLRKALPEESREWVYYGLTVQDLTDTWLAVTMRETGKALVRDLERIECILLDIAVEHRETPMLGRTHAQPGLPISFGYKTAVWAAEIGRHRKRLERGRSRWEVVQLGGALGTMEFWGDDALGLLDEFAGRIGLGVPDIPWLTSRDGVAEFCNLLGMVSSTFAKIGNEIMELQRPEIGEVREGFVEGTVGSITMPHKRNPEISEHLDTLGRIVRANAAVVVDGIVQIHERDGRGWKAEWAVIPEACALTLTSSALCTRVLEGLEVGKARMTENIESQGGYVFSELIMRALADRVGKHVAQEIVYEAAVEGRASGKHFLDALMSDVRVAGEFDRSELTRLFDLKRAIGSGPGFVDRVVAASDVFQP